MSRQAFLPASAAPLFVAQSLGALTAFVASFGMAREVLAVYGDGEDPRLLVFCLLPSLVLAVVGARCAMFAWSTRLWHVRYEPLSARLLCDELALLRGAKNSPLMLADARLLSFSRRTREACSVFPPRYPTLVFALERYLKIVERYDADPHADHNALIRNADHRLRAAIALRAERGG